MAVPEVVSPEQWQVARDGLLAKEKAATRLLDDLAAERRRLPMVAFGKEYAFQSPDGPVGLIDLFGGRRQLVLYQFMDNGPDDYCSGLFTAVTDNVARPRPASCWPSGHEARPPSRTCRWPRSPPTGRPHAAGRCRSYSSRGTDVQPPTAALPAVGFGLSVFLRDGASRSTAPTATTARGVDRLRFEQQRPRPRRRTAARRTGRTSPPGWPQTKPYEWWRLHDEYAQ